MPRSSTAVQPPKLKPPSALLLLLEGRAPWEYAAMVATTPLLNRLPQGDGHPVIVFPGLTAGDATTAPLRGFLRKRGYDVHAWGQGLNFGPREGVLERCQELAETLHRRHGRAVSLVGWSLGGLYAREVAKLLPAQVRCVVTLGTPFGGHPQANNAWRLYEWLSGQSVRDPALLARIQAPPPVPTTSIYSRTDGVVSWRCSLNGDLPHTENIELPASHLGMGVNPLALYALADRLAQDPARWQRFDSRGLRGLFYKTSVFGADAGVKKAGRPRAA